MATITISVDLLRDAIDDILCDVYRVDADIVVKHIIKRLGGNDAIKKDYWHIITQPEVDELIELKNAKRFLTQYETKRRTALWHKLNRHGLPLEFTDKGEMLTPILKPDGTLMKVVVII